MVERIDPADVSRPRASGLDPLVKKAQRGMEPRAPELAQKTALEALPSLTVLRSHPAVSVI